MDLRSDSIASAILDMRRLGISQAIDFYVRCKFPNKLLGYIAISAGLMAQDKWILSLPPVKAREGAIIILDEMTVIRTDPMPVVEPEGLDEHVDELLPEKFEAGDFDPEIDLVLAEQVMRKTYEEGHGIDIEGWGI
jgi:hypothetical protein